MHRRSFWTLALFATVSFAQSASTFPPLEQWKAAVLSGDSARVRNVYSISPPAQIDTGHGVVNASDEAAFWTGMKVRDMKVNIIQLTSPQPGVQKVLFQAEVKTPERTAYVTAVQL